MPVSGTLLCRALANRLNAVVPSGFGVTAYDGVLWVGSKTHPLCSGSCVQSLVEQDAGSSEDRITSAAYNALNSVQDFISEELHWPWPPTEGKARGYMAMPWAMLKDGKLLLGYGESNELTLVIEPIPLNAIDAGTPQDDA